MTKDNLMIRPAEPRDRDALVGILHRCWDAAFAPHLTPGATERYRADAIAEDFVAEEGAAITVAEMAGAAVGLAHTEDDVITALQVDPGRWGHGIGRALLAEAERQIAMRGHGKARLQVDDFNVRARALYRAAGYAETGRRPDTEFQSGTMTVSMERTLPAILRPWRPEDLAAGLDLFDSNTPRFFAPDERRDFIAFVEDLPGPYFMLEDAAGQPLGCGGFGRAEGDASVAVLCWGMVRQDRHKRGLGTLLLTERLQRIAADPSYRKVAIDTSQHSCGFFARFGFVEIRRVPDGFAPGMDIVDMELDLAAYRRSRAG